MATKRVARALLPVSQCRQLATQIRTGRVPVLGTHYASRRIKRVQLGGTNHVAGAFAVKRCAREFVTDTVLLPYANSAYRKLQRALGNAGGGGFIQDDVLLVVTAVTETDTSLQVSITDATAPPNQLPTDLLVPVKIWERPNCSTDDFLEMVDLTQHGGLPSREQDTTLSVWEWRADGIYFLGATQDTQIRLRYSKAYPDFTDATSPVLVRNSQEAIAYATAALAGWARGSPSRRSGTMLQPTRSKIWSAPRSAANNNPHAAAAHFLRAAATRHFEATP